ncbi:40S ribosomal protein S19 [Candidatus Woesearchaeota archaeon]|nr:40S ribosomal protein S19 [Candidatus Woesearchaeota archaeon]MCF7901730.1 40S ribosomal protein S19 [Candidatus Woesearchaeota archaeon]MCF8013629.1 40S ribosomal protein S19 [Candidatus Woesearchaeota archaeon]
MKDVDHTKLVDVLAKKLESTCVAPEWAMFVKTGHGKQRPPIRDDWWQVRAAAVLLSVQKLGPIGVSKLRVKYGNRKNKGNKPEGFVKGSGNILRKVLQQLEAAKLLKKEETSVHKGREITKEGNKLIIDASKELKGN